MFTVVLYWLIRPFSTFALMETTSAPLMSRIVFAASCTAASAAFAKLSVEWPMIVTTLATATAPPLVRASEKNDVRHASAWRVRPEHRVVRRGTAWHTQAAGGDDALADPVEAEPFVDLGVVEHRGHERSEAAIGRNEVERLAQMPCVEQDGCVGLHVARVLPVAPDEPGGEQEERVCRAEVRLPADELRRERHRCV